MTNYTKLIFKIVYVIIWMTIKFEDFDLNNTLVDEKLHENVLVYNISYKTLIGARPLRIRFDKIDVFIRFYHGTRYLVLFGAGILWCHLQQD